MNDLLNQLHFSKQIFYFVEDFDTLDSIANKFNTTPHLIIYDNKLDGQIITGQLLIINKVSGKIYTIKVGDSLTSIANGDADLIYKIKNTNKLDNIFVGQKIII